MSGINIVHMINELVEDAIKRAPLVPCSEIRDELNRMHHEDVVRLYHEVFIEIKYPLLRDLAN